MEIVRAEFMGFCAGVDAAIQKTAAAISVAQSAGRAIFSVGPIIHNAQVMDELVAAGLSVVSDIEDVPDGADIVIRSHGEPVAFFERAEEKGLSIVDATCVKVRHVQEIAAGAKETGQNLVVLGDPLHPEVVGIVGWGGDNTVVVTGDEDEIDLPEKFLQEGVIVIAQTTFNTEKFERAVALIGGKMDCGSGPAMTERVGHPSTEGDHPGPLGHPSTEGNEGKVVVRDTICLATARRQLAARELAGKVDLMVVIGDKKSSNTRKLLEISKDYCNLAILVENKSDLLLKDIVLCNRIGITAGASTPERIIKEVISSMSEFNSNNESNPMHEFMDEIEKSVRLPRNGDVVTGEVIQVTDNDVTVNLGCKKDGVIPKSEITLEEGQTLKTQFNEGDEVQAKVLKNDDGEGNILLSKKRVIVSEHWEDINKAYEEKIPLEVKVVREVNGGVIATFNEINGFIPLSQLSDRYVEKADEFVGQTLIVKVIRVDQKRNKVVFSHKAILSEERQKRMQEIWESLSVGDIIDGRVMRFTDYGAFVDIGGIDGLLHISEISWGKLRHPQDMLEINQEIKVKILSMNKEKEKISLGYKQNQPEPWTIINDKYQVGQVISGKAVQLKDYGVFVELEPGLDGLIHISEIAYRRVTDISEEIEVGQEITAKILEIDSDRKRISLSIKETLEKPEEGAEDAPIGNPSEEAVDPDKDQEFEIPDPDGVDAVNAPASEEVPQEHYVPAEPEPTAEEAELAVEEETFEAAAAPVDDADKDAAETDADPEVEVTETEEPLN
ncbi:MAG: 30S ribosomal protein S1 [Clostridiales Family XIII bacterium]|nr:30S ribosomal protein S1 [Clostridiales Family XIII bacterium]